MSFGRTPCKIDDSVTSTEAYEQTLGPVPDGYHAVACCGTLHCVRHVTIRRDGPPGRFDIPEAPEEQPTQFWQRSLDGRTAASFRYGSVSRTAAVHSSQTVRRGQTTASTTALLHTRPVTEKGLLQAAPHQSRSALSMRVRSQKVRPGRRMPRLQRP